jgi:predicted nucleotidyltransferase
MSTVSKTISSEKKKRTDIKKDPLIPDFLIIGAGKSGTTSLNNYLQQHPEIFIPELKEPNFFAYENLTIEHFSTSKEDVSHFHTSITDLNKYLDLFKPAHPAQLKGETSNTYLYYEGAAERIKQYNPDMKLIAVLRQPAGRLYSRFLHLARENRTPTQNFADCLNRDSIWWKRNDLVKEGFYFKYLSRFYELFPKENIRIYLYEDFQSKRQDVLRDIYTFLGVSEFNPPNVDVTYNESGFIKNSFLNKIYGQNGMLINAVKKVLPENAVSKVKNNLFVQKIFNKLRSKNLVKPKLDSKLKKQITEEIYGDDIRNLQNLLQRDLSHWLK